MILRALFLTGASHSGFAQVLYLCTSRVQVFVVRKPRCDVMEIMFLIIGSLPISSYFGFSGILENGFSKKLLVIWFIVG